MLLVGIAISFPLQIKFEYDYAWSDLAYTLDHLTYMNFAVMFLCLWVAYDSFVVSPRLKVSSLVLINLTIINNAFVGYVAINYSPWETAVASFFFILPFLYLLKPNIKALLTNTQLQWWKTPTRFNLNWAVKIDGLDSVGTSLNVSRSGILVKVNVDEWNKTRDKFITHSEVPLTIRAGNQNITPKATFVRQQMAPQDPDVYIAFKFDREIEI